MNKKLVLFGAGLLSALLFGAATQAQADPYGRYSRYESRRQAARQEIHQNWREIARDRAELRGDIQEYYQDLNALRRAQRRDASPAEIARLRNEVRQGAREIAQDRREVREDYAELNRDLNRYGYYDYYRYPNSNWWGWGNNWWGRSYDRRDYR